MFNIATGNKHSLKSNIIVNDKRFNAERNPFLYGLMGINGAGKSVLAMELAIAWKKSRPNGTIMAFDPTNAYNGVVDLYISLADDYWEEINKLEDALLIMDELRLLHPNDKANKHLLELMSIRRSRNIDIIYIVHNPSLILEVLTYLTDKYMIFYTQTKEGKFKDKIPNYAMCSAASNLVNNYVLINGIGTYPIFPYVVVDKLKGSVAAVNIDSKKVRSSI